LQASSSIATAATPALEVEEISSSLPSPVKMPRDGASTSSVDISEYDFSDLSLLPNVGNSSDDVPLQLP
jgi:hypothetical protein